MTDRSLLTVLSRFPSWARPLSEIKRLGNAGGTSGATIWRFRAAVGELALRAWPEDGPGPAELETIHAWLRQAEDPALPIAMPIPAIENQTLLRQDGRTWQLEPWMPGVPDPGHPPAKKHVVAVYAAVARFHERLSRQMCEGFSPGFNARINELRAIGFQGRDRLAAALANQPREAAHVAAGLRWLAMSEPVIDWLPERFGALAHQIVPLQPCLRDARPEHFLFEGDRLTGMIDFGAMGIETVAADLARLSGEWLGDDRPLRAVALEAYENIRPLRSEEIALMEGFEAVADVLIAMRWLSWHFLEQRQFDDPQAVARGISRGLDRLQRLLTRAGSSGLIPMFRRLVR
jgi:homoserine kinase type II